MRRILENDYRDFLADHLALIEPGMSLVEAEMRLPNGVGANGFVDIVARDRFGVVVLIEIKRSDSAARSAMHELFKYVALFRENHGLAPHQVRCILLSTTWHELGVPFSELYTASPFQLEGRILEIGEDGSPQSTRPYTRLPLQQPLSLCPKHGILLFFTAKARDSAVADFATLLAPLGVTDYLILPMDYKGPDPRVIYPFAAYLALSEFDTPTRANIERIAFGERAEFDDEAAGLAEPMDASEWEHEEWATARVFNHRWGGEHTVEIGYPDKFRTMLRGGGWIPSPFQRSGRFTSRAAWPEPALTTAILSENDQYSTYFSTQVSTANTHACARLLENLDRPLLGTGPWATRLPEIINSLIGEEDVTSVSLRLYSPSALLYSLTLTHCSEDYYLPGFELVVEQQGPGLRTYVGALAWNQRRFPKVSLSGLSEALPEGLDSYRIANHFAEQWRFESALCEAHGLRYAIYESVEDGKGVRSIVRADDGAAVPDSRKTVPPGDLFNESIDTFLARNDRYIRSLHRALNSATLNSDRMPIDAML